MAVTNAWGLKCEYLGFEDLFFWCLTITGPDCPGSELITVYMNSPYGDARLPQML